MAIDTAPAALYKFFVERVRDNLHIVLTLSPIGHNLRRYLYCYTPLRNLCTSDWFMPWPADALQHIAEKLISSMNLSQTIPANALNDGESVVVQNANNDEQSAEVYVQLTESERKLVEIAVYFNHSTAEMADR